MPKYNITTNNDEDNNPDANPWDDLLHLLEEKRRGTLKHISGLERGLYAIHNKQSSKKPGNLGGELTQARKRLLQIEEKILEVQRSKLESEERRSEVDYLAWWSSTKTSSPASIKKNYDLFISHASHDKDLFVRPLAEQLVAIGLSVWYDEFELRLGDSLRKSIDRGVAESRYGLVVLSEAFFGRPWTEYELNGFIAKELGNDNVVLPLWHKVSKDEVLSFSPALADKVAIKTSDYSLSELARLIYERIKGHISQA